ncbi:Arm DNA-binding domain-containing protein [Cupriavidus taiwanensis]|nr:Arm DNA-binding domain-containing protein [Cupriavidus taiwanensis]
MAKRESKVLSDVQLRHWIAEGSPVAKSDGDGLTFTLSAADAASWVLRFSHGGRRHELTLGSYPDLSLGGAQAGRRPAGRGPARHQPGDGEAQRKIAQDLVGPPAREELSGAHPARFGHQHATQL